MKAYIIINQEGKPYITENDITYGLSAVDGVGSNQYYLFNNEKDAKEFAEGLSNELDEKFEVKEVTVNIN